MELIFSVGYILVVPNNFSLVNMTKANFVQFDQCVWKVLNACRKSARLSMEKGSHTKAIYPQLLYKREKTKEHASRIRQMTTMIRVRATITKFKTTETVTDLSVRRIKLIFTPHNKKTGTIRCNTSL